MNQLPFRPVWLHGFFVACLCLALPAWSQESAGDPKRGDPKPGEPKQGEKEKQGEKQEPKKKGQSQWSPANIPSDWTKSLTWRSIGPANMGGRITALAVYEADPSTYFVATASGGLLKTTNNGTTFQHQFDHEATVSIGDVCVSQSNPDIVWVGTGENNPRNSVSFGDGVYKSIDGGKTWQNMGLRQIYQVGKILIHPTNPDIVYVGALGRLYGPNSERGLFKTMDGGKTWNKVFHLNDRTGIIDMRLHPTEPDTLLVAAWERQRDGFDSFLNESAPPGYDGYDPSMKWGSDAGIYKSIDGGNSFKKITKGLPTNKLGRIGLDYCRKNPNIVYAIVDCEKIGMGTPPKRKIIAATAGYFGENAEGGVRVTAIQDNGPAAKAGIEQDDMIVAINKKEIKAFIDIMEDMQDRSAGDKITVTLKRDKETKDVELTLAERPQPKGELGAPPGAKKDRPYHANLGGQAPNKQDDQGPDAHEYGGVFKSIDGGESWTRVNSVNPRPMYFSQIRVDPSNENNVYVLGVAYYKSEDGGKTFKTGAGVHADHHAMWIDPRDGRHMIIGTDGGFYVTHDRMATWDHHNHLALGQFYHVAVDSKKPYYVYGGLQDNGSWGGPSHGLKGGVGPINEDWISIGGGDGFVCRVDPHDPDLVYYESQNGSMGRRNLRTGETGRIRPADEKGGGKGGARTGKKGGEKAAEKGEEKGEEKAGEKGGEKTGEKGSEKDKTVKHRFNWNAPFILSNHNPKIFYCAGEFVWRSLDRGNDLRVISPEITLTKRGSATALSESPKNPDVLWVGTDDGALWITRDGGKQWTNVTSKVGLPAPLWVATIEASRFAEGRCYVAFDGHRSDLDDPFVFVTEDFGESWKPIGAKLPVGSSRCLREDVKNPNLLFVGTEFAVFASLDRGESWTRLNNNLPTVAVHEIAIHPTAGEIVAATHGRSLWILDISALRQVTGSTVAESAHLYKPQEQVRWRQQPTMGRTTRRYVGTNAPRGAPIYYSLAAPAENVSLKIVDITGKVLREMKGPKTAGFHKVTWDMASSAPQQGKGKEAASGGGGFGGRKGEGKGGAAKGGKEGAGKEGEGTAGVAGGGFGPFGFAQRPMVQPGEYRVVLTVDGRELAATLRVEADPLAPATREADAEDD